MSQPKKEHQKKEKKRIGIAGKITITGILLLILVIFLGIFLFNSGERAAFYHQQAIARQEREKWLESHNRETVIPDVSTALETYLPGIVCWGDSLTEGYGGEGVTYPGVLQWQIDNRILARTEELSLPEEEAPEVPVVNMGITGETTYEILGRSGAVPYVIRENFVMPGDVVPVEITIQSAKGQDASPREDNRAGMETVSIGDVEGTISIDWENCSKEFWPYWFTRTAPGKEKMIPAGTRIITSGSTEYRNYIPVIFMGTNGDYDSPRDLIEQHNALIRHQIGNPRDGAHPRFIVVGMHIFDDLEAAMYLEDYMQEEFGDQYINLRKYMSEKGMEDAGLTPTEEDLRSMEAGEVPPSLMYDELHFNADGYELLGKLVYNRMDSLHYFDEVNQAIDRALASEQDSQ